MEGTYHALGLLALPAVTVACCAFARRRKVDGPVLLVSSVAAVLTLFFVLTLNAHLCHSGDPVTQALIGSIALWLCLLCIDRRWVRIPLALLIVVCTFALAYHYVQLVHRPDWIGRPQVRQAVVAVIHQSSLASVKNQLTENWQENDTIYPAGWVRDMPFRECFDEAFIRSDDIFRVNIGRAWHTIFTRLFPVKRIPQDFWYPGGTIAQAVDSIVIKDRP